MIQNSEVIKVKFDKFYYIKIKKELAWQKNTISKVKSKLEKIFTTYHNKELIVLIYKEPLKV